MEGDECGYYVNEVDGLPNEHPALPEFDSDEPSSSAVDRDSFDDLPTSIIVTNIHSEVFVDEELKAEMESLFREFSKDVTFHWLKSFRRLRVNYTDAVSAANARIQLHQYKINKSIINCYFAQPITPVSIRNLQPPALTKQFLISPPCSPPAGWEQADECEPIGLNEDLLAALSNLTPGEVYELHAAAESQPAIVVHTPKMPGEEDAASQNMRVEIIPTKCPERA